MLICMVTKDLIDKFKASEIIREIAPIVGGKGGGRDERAQGGGGKPQYLRKALEHVYEMVKTKTEA